jgi:hypothetical protein
MLGRPVDHVFDVADETFHAQAWHAPCSTDGVSQHKETPMAAYLMAVFAASFAAASALTLIYTVNHFDPPQSQS